MNKICPASDSYNQYQIIDVMKYIAAIMVICIHANEISNILILDFIVKNIICRIAVPFFFISNAYFVRKNSQNTPSYFASYLKTLFKSYLAWSIVFIPLGIDWIHQNFVLPQYLLPFALLIGFFYIGTYYHLWYIPAMIFSLWLANKLLKRISYKRIFLFSFFLFIFGSFETYYAFLPEPLKSLFDLFISITFTTRNGLFFGLIFIVMGFFIADYQSKLLSLVKKVPMLVLVFGLLLIGEGLFLYPFQRLDMNFLIMLLPFSFFFFLWLLSLPLSLKKSTKKLRVLSKYYFFVHPICLLMITELGTALNFPFFSKGIISLVLTCLLTHLLSCVAVKMENFPKSYWSILHSVFLGILATLVIGSVIYRVNQSNSYLKFELIPAIWVFSSFLIYYHLSSKKRKIFYLV